MESSHIQNAINMLYRKEDDRWNIWISVFTEELGKRAQQKKKLPTKKF
jgi:hypothetical protein